MALTEERVLEALRTVMDPELGKDLVSLGMVDEVRVEGGRVDLLVNLTTPACPLKGQIEADIRRALAPLGATPSPGSSTWWPWPRARAGWGRAPWPPTWPWP